MFLFATSRDTSCVFIRITDPDTGVVPTSEQIVQDIHKAVRALQKIHETKGAFVPGLAGDRVQGHHNVRTTDKTSNNHGCK